MPSDLAMGAKKAAMADGIEDPAILSKKPVEKFLPAC